MPGGAKGRGTLCLATRAAVVVFSVLLPYQACAGAFFHEVQSIRSAGRATAGSVAVADDASTIFLNPAGMTELQGPEVTAGLSVILARTDVEDRGTQASTPGTGGAFVPLGGQAGEPLDPALLPNLFAALPLMRDRLWIGLGITAPFGLITEYDHDWFGRYDSTESELVTIDVAPTIAVKVTDWLSIGAGLNVQYADATLQNAVPNPLAPGGPSAATDGIFRASGNDVSLGYNVGVLLKPWPRTRIGLHYRSEIEHDVEGEATLSGLTGPLAGLNRTSDASAELNLPAIASFGVAHDLTERLTLLGQASWYGWDTFRELRIRFVDGAPDLVELQNYEDSWAIGLGAQYRLSDDWTLRGGLQYDQTPTEDGFRNTRVPDGDRYWVAIGASYELSQTLGFDFAYSHRFFETTGIDRTRTFYEGTPLESAVAMDAKARTGADVFSVQLRLSF